MAWGPISKKLQTQRNKILLSMVSIIKSFCEGPGGGFFKKSPLAAGGKEYINLICQLTPGRK